MLKKRPVYKQVHIWILRTLQKQNTALRLNFEYSLLSSIFGTLRSPSFPPTPRSLFTPFTPILPCFQVSSPRSHSETAHSRSRSVQTLRRDVNNSRIFLWEKIVQKFSKIVPSHSVGRVSSPARVCPSLPADSNVEHQGSEDDFRAANVSIPVSVSPFYPNQCFAFLCVRARREQQKL